MRLPSPTLGLDRHGLARELSLPAHGDCYESPYVSSYRALNGVLHNPRSDRRTTQGTFHVTTGGLPIPAEKKAVPKRVFAALFQRAAAPPRELLRLPFTAHRDETAKTFVSLMLRPVVCPETPGLTPEKTMEVRFFAPGSLVSNLDFVESIFGNAGDPHLPENDAALDAEHWTGHTGAVLLAPHLTQCTKRDLGLPHYDEATPRQKRDGMCWRQDDELYNEGRAFKITCRTDAGVIVTLIADNYFGYCKKEVKTQISYAANLYGGVEEEHSGGAIAFASYNLGDEFQVDSRKYNGRTLEDVVRDFGDEIELRSEGYAVDRRHADVLYLPEDALVSLREQRITWRRNGESHAIPVLPGRYYLAPSGYQLRIEKHPAAPSWRLIGTAPQGVFLP